MKVEGEGRTPPAVYVLTRKGLDLALRLSGERRIVLFAQSSLRSPLAGDDRQAGIRWFERLPPLVAENFSSFPLHLFITAAGIAVRCIAPLLKDKSRDPAVLVMDQNGEHVISLLSGHQGGANREAREIAALMDARPVITTASDLQDLPSLDCLALEHNLAIAEPSALTTVSAALVDGRPVGLDDPQDHLKLSGHPAFSRLELPPGPDQEAQGRSGGPEEGVETAARVIVTVQRQITAPGTLILHPRLLYAGIGCRRGTGMEAILEAITNTLDLSGLAPASLAGLASIEDKRDERGIFAAARALGLPVHLFPRQCLAAYPVGTPSAKARQRFGIDGVCEPSALAAAAGERSVYGQGKERGSDPVHRAELAVAKQIHGGVTVAIALRGQPA